MKNKIINEYEMKLISRGYLECYELLKEKKYEELKEKLEHSLNHYVTILKTFKHLIKKERTRKDLPLKKERIKSIDELINKIEENKKEFYF